MKMLSKIKKKISKIKQKLGLKNKQSEKSKESVKAEVLTPIPPIEGAAIEVTMHFDQFNAAKAETSENGVLGTKNRDDFKNSGKENQLKILLAYLHDKSEEGIYKRESSKVIADYFKVSKDTIQRRFNELLERKYIIELKSMNTYYKIKEWL